jgi:hypothetical protein
MELLGDAGHVQPRFGLFGDSVSVRKLKVHGLRRTYYRSKIVLDTHDGTARWLGPCGISFRSICW